MIRAEDGKITWGLLTVPEWSVGQIAILISVLKSPSPT